MTNQAVTSYLASVQTDRNQVVAKIDVFHAELPAVEAELASASEELEGVKSALQRSGKSLSVLTGDGLLRINAATERRDAAQLQHTAITSTLKGLEKMRVEIEAVIEAPMAFERARQAVAECKKNLQDLGREVEQVVDVSARLEARIAELNQATDRALRATKADMAAGKPFAASKELSGMDLELRVARELVAENNKKIPEREQLRVDMLQQLDAARRTCRVTRAAFAAIELRAQLVSVLPAIARAAAAASEADAQSTDSSYVIDIPPALVDEARAALAAELP